MASRRKKSDPRPTWDEYFMEIAFVVAKRSNCSRRKVAAVVAKDRHFDGGCPRCAGKTPSGKGLDECLCVHAEQNAICQAARYGVDISGSTIYITLSPCLTCAKLIINAGIKEVVYAGDYTAFLDTVKDMFRQSGVKCREYRIEN